MIRLIKNIRWSDPKDWNPLGKYYLVLFFSIFILFLYFSISTLTPNIKIISKIWSSLADTCLALLICELFRGKWKLFSLVVPFVISFLISINLLYFRNFHDLIPPVYYSSGIEFNSFIRDGITSSIKLFDIILILIPFLPVFYILTIKRTLFYQLNPGRKTLVGTTCFTVFLWVMPYLIIYGKNTYKNKKFDFADNLGFYFDSYNINWRYFYDTRNFAGYAVAVLANLGNSGEKLSDSQILLIKQGIREATSRRKDISPDNNYISKSNLIVILVESLTYTTFQQPDAPIIMPYMFSLFNDSTVLKTESNVKVLSGRSSDAQFIYNTGLLPLTNEPLVVNYADKDYPSLAKALGINSIEIIGEDKSVWLHGTTSKSYGFSRLDSGIAANCLNQDSIIFQYALQEIKKLPEPFFMEITTLSMHGPYTEPKVTPSPEIDKLPYDDSRLLEFYQRLNHTDKYLGQFLDKLKGTDIYDNTIIIITGDHEVGKWLVPPSFTAESVPWFILNSGVSASDIRHAGVTQLDFFPTVLDLMGKSYNYRGENYRGLGKSLIKSLNKDTLPHEPKESDYNISELIIRGR